MSVNASALLSLISPKDRERKREKRIILRSCETNTCQRLRVNYILRSTIHLYNDSCLDSLLQKLFSFFFRCTFLFMLLRFILKAHVTFQHDAASMIRKRVLNWYLLGVRFFFSHQEVLQFAII